MATEREVSKALSTIRAIQSTFRTKRRPGMTDVSRDMNTQRIRALEGLCGHCINLDLAYKKRQGKEVVLVGCKRGLNPQELYFQTPLGEKAECPLFRPEPDRQMD